MMDKLEVCRLSAEALGKEILSPEEYPDTRSTVGVLDSETVVVSDQNGIHEWDPLENASQRWECVEWLLAHGYDVGLWPEARHYLWDQNKDRFGDRIEIECPASEFPARAVAEISRTFRARG